MDHTLKFYNSIKLSQYVYNKQYYPNTLSICTNGSVHTFSLLHANDVSSETLQRLYSMSISCLRHWFLRVAQLHSNSWMFQYGPLYCHLSKKLLAGSLMREEKLSLKVRRQTSLLVFIFIFYTSLNVQRVSCSIVKYLYIHVSIFVDLFGPTDFLV